jgi:tyrosyl-tRNA synthetase
VSSGFLEVMRERGLMAQVVHEQEFAEHLASGRRTAYIGFDPTAPSLHVGSLMQIMTLVRWQRAGHRVVALVGGGTGLIGDPSGKTDMRQLLTPESIKRNMEGIKAQLAKFVDFSSPEQAIMVDNADWLLKLEYLPFLRDYGKHFSVNRMLTAECFRQRLEKGLSFLEFNYMLLQSYDFLHLYRTQKCTVQLGGDDQWSNILSGMELVRRLEQAQAFCATTPLVTTSDGRKMGKTEQGAVWLDGALTSPFDYWQYWRNVEDASVEKCLRFFTHLPMERVRELGSLKGSAINEAKKILAWECTAMLHGKDAADAAQASAEQLFTSGGRPGAGGAEGAAGSEPTTVIDRALVDAGMPVADFLIQGKVAESKSEARRLIQQGGLALGDKKVDDIHYKVTLSDFDSSGSCLVRKGKKHWFRYRIS